MDTTLRIIGYGEVARGFLDEAAPRHPALRFRVYRRATSLQSSAPAPAPNIHFEPLEELRAEDSPLLVCCSVNEAELLTASRGMSSRLQVAAANLELFERFPRLDAFARGPVFVVTNPSELIAQRLFERTGNSQLRALGLSIDQERIRAVLRGLGLPDPGDALAITGNHSLRPLPVLSAHPGLLAALERRLSKREGRPLVDAQAYDALHRLVQEKTATEFSGSKPPAFRGSQALRELLQALLTASRLPLSAPVPLAHRTQLVGGTFDFRSGTFEQPALSRTEMHLLERILQDTHTLPLPGSRAS
jgi:hypothetical protein